MEYPKEVDIAETNAPFAGQMCPIVSSSMEIEGDHFGRAELVGQDNLGSAAFGYKPVALLMA